MTLHANQTRSRWAPALALLGTLAVPGAAHAGFEITYLRTDSEGNAITGDRLTANEMNQYVNHASCQCGDKFAVRIFLNNNAGDTTVTPTTRVMTYVGTSCDEGQNAISNYPPCVQLTNLQASEYDDQGLIIEFDQVWLSSGASGVNQPLASATPQSPCPESQTGTGKVWICVDSDNNSQCLSGEFITPTVLNTTGSTSGGSGQPTTGGTDDGQTTSDGITYDYQPPLSTVTGFTSSAGDGKVDIRWARAEVNDISGFRVLCADQDGNPARPGLVPSVLSRQARTNGKLYYTANNLCEQTVYGDAPTGGGGGGGGGGSGGRDTDTTTGDTTTGDGSTGDASTGDGSTDGSTDGGLATGLGTSTGGDATGGAVTLSACDDDPSGSVLCGLDWAYVCSDHIPPGTVSATVTGLRNDEPYEFIVVAYDTAGNPKAVSPVLVESPIETYDFWEQCEQKGDICGNGGFCHCRSGAPAGGGAWLGVGLMLLGLARRRRAR